MANAETGPVAHTPESPWWVVQADDKKRARLNTIAHLLAAIPYSDVPKSEVILPERIRHPDYHGPVPEQMYVKAVY